MHVMNIIYSILNQNSKLSEWKYLSSANSIQLLLFIFPVLLKFELFLDKTYFQNKKNWEFFLGDSSIEKLLSCNNYYWFKFLKYGKQSALKTIGPFADKRS